MVYGAAHCGLQFWDLDIKLDAAAIDGVAKAQLLTHNTVSVFGETLTVFLHRIALSHSMYAPI